MSLFLTLREGGWSFDDSATTIHFRKKDSCDVSLVVDSESGIFYISCLCFLQSLVPPLKN
jgi:hypothetical protein